MKKTWQYYDYCHVPYQPIAPVQKKLSADVLLYNSLLGSSYQKTFLSIVNKIKDAIGPWNTVWGVKLDHGMVTWELYFYNHRVNDPRKSVAGLLKVLKSNFKIPVFLKIGIESQPYMMFSVDLGDDIFRSQKIDGVHLYMDGGLGKEGGNSYYWGPRGLYFENHYDFFPMPQEVKPFIHQVKHSVFMAQDSTSFLKHPLVRKLMPCHKICVAHKKDKDGIYFSRVNLDQFLYFLEYFSYPDHIVDFVRSNKEKLDHLLYDVAFDCSLGPQGFEFKKSSYYGVC